MKYYGKALGSVLVSALMVALSHYLGVPLLEKYSIESFVIFYVLTFYIWRPIYTPGDVPLKEALQNDPLIAVAQTFGMLSALLIAVVSIFVQSIS